MKKCSTRAFNDSNLQAYSWIAEMCVPFRIIKKNAALLLTERDI
jgi:hypothetical protein